MLPSARTVLLASILVVSAACSKPEPPTLVPKEAAVSTVTANGVALVVKVDARNPNRIPLATRAVTAKVRVDGKYDLASVTMDKPIELAPNATTPIDVPMQMTWTDAQILGSLVAANRTIPFTVEGTMAIGGERLNVDVPFRIDGTLTREQLIEAGLRSLKIPGLGPP